MKELLITILRDKTSSMVQFRAATEKLAMVLATESAQFVSPEAVTVNTPLGKTEGVALKNPVMLVSILRAGLTFLPAFLQFYPDALVGFIGARRDETTAIPQLYYTKLPPFSTQNRILLLDPMLATGGSSCLAIRLLKEAGATESQITLISAIAAPEGIQHLKQEYPNVGLLVAQIDDHLDPNKFIFPGLGDFGDRYFGTVN